MSHTMVSNFNKRFVELANTLPYNDSELAQKLNVSRQTISAWRTGVRSPHTPAIQFVAQTLGVNVAWLSGWDVPMYEGVVKETKPQRDLDPEDYDRLEALHQNPRLGLLFDRVKDLDEEDIQFMEKYANAIIKERDGD